jgi:hypothetical protein
MRTRSALQAQTSFVLNTILCALAVLAVVMLSLQLPQDTAPHRTSAEQTTAR